MRDISLSRMEKQGVAEAAPFKFYYDINFLTSRIIRILFL